MGWGSCGTDSKGRPIGYGHRGKCDHKGCKTRIDRGLAYACGGMHGRYAQSEDTHEVCEGYFCPEHLTTIEPFGAHGDSFQVCETCYRELIEIGHEHLSDELTIAKTRIAELEAKAAGAS